MAYACLQQNQQDILKPIVLFATMTISQTRGPRFPNLRCNSLAAGCVWRFYIWPINEKKLQNLIDSMGSRMMLPTLRRTSKSIFGLVWPWPLTSPRGLQTDHFMSCPVDHLRQFASKSVRSFSKYRVDNFGNRRTDGRTDKRTDIRTDNARST